MAATNRRSSLENEAFLKSRVKEVRSYIIRYARCHCYRPQRSWAKVIFSQACVKNSVHRGGGRVSASVHAGIHPPPGQTHPPGSRPPRSGPPRSRHPRSRHPPGKQIAAYGQRAAGTHPTGMHSC